MNSVFHGRFSPPPANNTSDREACNWSWGLFCLLFRVTLSPQCLPLVCPGFSRDGKGLWGRVRERERCCLTGSIMITCVALWVWGELDTHTGINCCALNTGDVPSNWPLAASDASVQLFLGLSCCPAPKRISWAEFFIPRYILIAFCRVHMEPEGNSKPKPFLGSHLSSLCFCLPLSVSSAFLQGWNQPQSPCLWTPDQVLQSVILKTPTGNGDASPFLFSWSVCRGGGNA